MESLGIDYCKDKFPAQMSGGEQQRVAIARALIMHPAVVYADEPTGNLDAESAENVAAMLSLAAAKYKQTIVMVTHNMQQAVRISDNTAFFLLGEMVEYGRSEQLFSMPQDKRTEDYITGRFG